ETINNTKMLSKVNCPILIVHSKEDDLIPYKCAQINYECIKHPWKKMLTIKGGHSSPVISKEQMKSILNYADAIDKDLYDRDKGCHLDTCLKRMNEAGDQPF